MWELKRGGLGGRRIEEGGMEEKEVRWMGGYGGEEGGGRGNVRVMVRERGMCWGMVEGLL